MKLKKYGYVYNFVASANLKDTHRMVYGNIDVCSMRILLLKCILMCAAMYSALAGVLFVAVSTLVTVIAYINYVNGVDVTYYLNLPEAVQVFGTVSSIIAVIVFTGMLYMRFTGLFMSLIRKSVNSTVDASKNVKTTPIADMYKSWKGKYCTKVELVE